MKKNVDELSLLYVYQDGMEWNPVEKVIMERRSIRRFKKKTLPDSIIKRILEAGRFAPSAGNAQPWKFVVLKDPKVIAEMERDAVRLSKISMWFMDYERNFVRKILLTPIVKLFTLLMPNMLHPIPFNLLKQIADEKVSVFHNAPVMILPFVDKRGVGTPALDLGICGQNMVIAAHSLGVGTCWIGMITLIMKLPKWKKYFSIKYPYSLDDCLIMGWPAGDYDGEVDREVQIVEWIDENGRRFEKQGE